MPVEAIGRIDHKTVDEPDGTVAEREVQMDRFEGAHAKLSGPAIAETVTRSANRMKDT